MLDSPNDTLWNVGPDHSALMLAARITLAHFSVKLTINVLSWVGDIAKGSFPSAARRVRSPFSASAALISWLSVPMISGGVCTGAPMPSHPLAS